MVLVLRYIASNILEYTFIQMYANTHTQFSSGINKTSREVYLDEVSLAHRIDLLAKPFIGLHIIGLC